MTEKEQKTRLILSIELISHDMSDLSLDDKMQVCMHSIELVNSHISSYCYSRHDNNSNCVGCVFRRFCDFYHHEDFQSHAREHARLEDEIQTD